MHTTRSRLPTIVLIAVLAALPPAAVLQFHLLDQASEAQAARLGRLANGGVRAIRSDIAYEVTSLVSVLTSVGPLGADLAGAAVSIDAWVDASRFPGLVERIVVALPPDRDDPGEPRYFSRVPGDSSGGPDGRGFTATGPRTLSWLADVEFDAATQTWVIPDQPFVLALPASLPAAGDGAQPAVAEGAAGPAYLLIEVDRAYFADAVLRELVAEHLGSGPDAFEAAALDVSNQSVVYSTSEVDYDDFAFAGTDGRIVADDLTPLLWPGSTNALVSRLTTPLRGTDAPPVGPDPRSGARAAVQVFTLLDWLRSDASGGGRGVEPRDGPFPHAEPRVPDEGLALAVWHPSGGIERAARIDRNRNLVLSYGFLAGVAAMAILFHALHRRMQRQRVREQEFIATVTHELRTPVSAMHASAENLAEGVVTDPVRVREYGRSLLAEGRRLRTLIDQTLDLAGLQAGGRRHRARGRLEAVVDDVLAVEPGVDGKEVRVRFERGNNGMLVEETIVRSVLANLVSNAGKHNPRGTTITVCATIEDDKGRAWLVLRVQDDGVGIPRRELRRVRQAFFRGTRSQRAQVAGTGLGLSIVDRVVTMAGGNLHIDSEEGRGTTVTVRLPYDADDERRNSHSAHRG